MRTERFVIRRRCDTSMRRSKEQCRLPSGKFWKCSGECNECMCCIYTDDEGKEAHVSMMYKNPGEREV